MDVFVAINGKLLVGIYNPRFNQCHQYDSSAFKYVRISRKDMSELRESSFTEKLSKSIS
tara:strand:- start:480 stop:656 length:177 start_codon:yes stop_codon:yes gene_type:complete